MSQERDDAGRFTATVTEQEILKVFDYEDDPVLSAQEVADGLKRFDREITNEGVRHRLNQMEEAGLVSRKELGARAVAWWANVAPELSAETERIVDGRAESSDFEEF